MHSPQQKKKTGGYFFTEETENQAPTFSFGSPNASFSYASQTQSSFGGPPAMQSPFTASSARRTEIRSLKDEQRLDVPPTFDLMKSEREEVSAFGQRSFLHQPSSEQIGPSFHQQNSSQLISREELPNQLPPVGTHKPQFQAASPTRSLHSSQRSQESMHSSRESLPNGMMHGSMEMTQSATYRDDDRRFTRDDDRSRPIKGDYWVTVFGFNENQLASVIRQFQQMGEIVEQIPGDGNWIHLKYKNSTQAKYALTKDRKIIMPGLMIGVAPGIIPSSEKKYAIGFDQPHFAESHEQNANAFQPNPSKTAITNIFPPSSNKYQVQPIVPSNAPRPQTSIWTWILEYLFGT